MFALRAGSARHDWAKSLAAGVRASAGSGIVLPRWLRRPVRIISRLDSDGWQPPRFLMLGATAAVLLSSGVAGMHQGGHGPAVVEAIATATGFAVESVNVKGNIETSEIDILERLELDGWTSLVGFNVAAARERIERLPWVEWAAVRKVYPGSVEIELRERKPFAIWQHGSELTLVERSGRPIGPFRQQRFATLPLVVGFGAPEQSALIVDEVARFPTLAPRVKAYIRVAERRWNLRLDNGVTVKLPENDQQRALADLARLDAEHDVLGRDVASIDLRLSDRFVFRLTPEGDAARQATLKQRGLKIAPRERQT